MDLMFTTLGIILSFIGFFICLSVHEASHALIADRLGDPTSKLSGRLSLNPLSHIDLFGTVLVPLLLILSGAPVFGWAKPVMVDIRNFKNPPRDNFLTALAGPVSNFLFAVVLAFILRFIASDSLPYALIANLVIINIALGIFNLVPIPPLDGSKVWHLLLPDESYFALERMGPVILIAFIIFINFSGGSFFNLISQTANALIRLFA